IVHGVMPALRPRLPSSEARPERPIWPFHSAMHGSWRTPVGEYCDCTGVFPSAVQVAFTKVLGRPVRGENWRLSALPVRTLNGRPAPTSICGANVQLLKNLLAKPLPLSLPDW